MEILDQAFEAARTFRPMGEAEVEALLAKTAGARSRGEFELFKTSSIFDSTATNPKWLGRGTGEADEPPARVTTGKFSSSASDPAHVLDSCEHTFD